MQKPKGHKLVGFNCDPELSAKIRRAAAPYTVSQFLRNVIVRELKEMGLPVDESMAAAPSREGVGGGRSRAESLALRATEKPSDAPKKKARKEKPKA